MLKISIISFLLLSLFSNLAFSSECLKNTECRSSEVCKVFSCVEKVEITESELKQMPATVNDFSLSKEKIVVTSGK